MALQLVSPTAVDEPASETPPEDWWVPLANCAGTDPDLFFPGRGESTRPAREVCAACKVRPECLEHSIRVPERFGIWGGMSERERRRYRRQVLTARRAGQLADPNAWRALLPPVDLDADTTEEANDEFRDDG